MKVYRVIFQKLVSPITSFMRTCIEGEIGVPRRILGLRRVEVTGG
jgi:hypothetical protein